MIETDLFFPHLSQIFQSTNSDFDLHLFLLIYYTYSFVAYLCVTEFFEHPFSNYSF